LYQKIWFISICFISIGFFVIIAIKKRYKRLLTRDRLKNELRINILELETKVVKAQMNPHFIFNSLNSIQQFILSKDNDNAYKYLSKFSKLVRKLLESTTTENITLEDEIDLLTRYIEIEALRFEETFSYEIRVDPKLNRSVCRIPHMIIQPFVENAIWHGLLDKTEGGKLSISFEYFNEKCLLCKVDDNGVGRSVTINTIPLTNDKYSLATEFIKKRLDLINELKDANCGFEIIDKNPSTHNETGTLVEIKVPVM
jgi:LytS/YehU family sensor histidine kinase